MSMQIPSEKLRQALYRSEDSDVGRGKKQFLAIRRLVCLRSPGVSPCYRVTWEQLRMYERNHKRNVVAQMAQAKERSDLAETYRRLRSDSPVRALIMSVKDNVLSRIPGLNPSFGFDVDIFLDVTDIETETSQAYVFFDLLPRFERGRVAGGYAGPMPHSVPFVYFDDIERSLTESVLGTLIFGELFRELRTDSQKVTHRWETHQGLWYIDDPALQELFINRTVISMMEEGGTGRTIISAGVTSDLKGTPIRAHLAFTSGKR